MVSAPSTLLLLRHFDRNPDTCGQEVSLLTVGTARAAELWSEPGAPHRRRPGRPLVVHCSPFLRCMQSVAPLCRDLGSRPPRVDVVIDWRLAEHPIEHGVDDEMARRHAREHLSAPWIRLHLRHRGAAPAGEPAGDMRERAAGFARDLAAGAGAGGLDVVCSHQSVLRELSRNLGCAHQFDAMGDMVRLDLVSSTT